MMEVRHPLPPPPTVAKQPRQIISEEEYTSTLTHIVTKDYFPSLFSLRRDAAVLDARQRGDVASAVAIRREARRQECQRDKEWADDQKEEIDAVRVRRTPRPLKHESVTGFHARVTSEDNAEFEKNQEREVAHRENMLGIIFSATADTAGRLLIESQVNGRVTDAPNERLQARTLSDSPLPLASDLYNPSPSAGLRITACGKSSRDIGEKACFQPSSTGIARNGLFFQPQHHTNNRNSHSDDLLLIQEAPRASSGGTFLAIKDNSETVTESSSDNPNMPPPPARHLESFEGNHDTRDNHSMTLPTYVQHRHQLVEYIPKSAIPNINPPATRFPFQNESRLLPKNPTVATSFQHLGRDLSSIDGILSDTTETTDIDEIPRPLPLERAARQKARKRENETFVPMTPLIEPGTNGKHRGIMGDNDGPIMTWGKIASYPMGLGNGLAVDGSISESVSNVDWEPTPPTNLSLGVGFENEFKPPVFDVFDENEREDLAHRASKKIHDRTKKYLAAGTSGLVETSSLSNVRADEVLSQHQSKITSNNNLSFDRTASLTPAARALFEANSTAHRAKERNKSNRKSTSCIFSSTSPAYKKGALSSGHAGSRDSFGSTLRMSYTPNATPSHDRQRVKDRCKKSTVSSSLRNAVGGMTPQCHSFH